MRSSGNWSRPAALAALTMLLAVTAGCGSSDRDEPEAKAKASATATASKAPEGITAQTLFDALPEDDYFPKGSAVSARCPGNEVCSNDAVFGSTVALQVSPALPAGAQQDTSSLDGAAKYRVEGGEWDEEIKLRAWLYSDAAEPAGYVEQYSSELEKLNGTVDVAPEKTKSGYNYGSRGTRSYQPLSIKGWKGFVQVQRVTYIHLDGHETEPRFVVYAVLSKGKVYARVDTSNTVQGRSQGDAVETVTDLLGDYAERVDG